MVYNQTTGHNIYILVLQDSVFFFCFKKSKYETSGYFPLKNIDLKYKMKKFGIFLKFQDLTKISRVRDGMRIRDNEQFYD